MKAKTERYVAVFVSRLLPETTAEEMEAFVQETHHLSSKCVKLETKHDSYASFKVAVTCDNVPDIYDPEKWAVGAYIRRYYNVAAFYRQEITFGTFNCNGFKSFQQSSEAPLSNCDMLCLQETMLTKQECSVLNSFHDNYYGNGVAPVDETLGVIQWRIQSWSQGGFPKVANLSGW